MSRTSPSPPCHLARSPGRGRAPRSTHRRPADALPSYRIGAEDSVAVSQGDLVLATVEGTDLSPVASGGPGSRRGDPLPPVGVSRPQEWPQPFREGAAPSSFPPRLEGDPRGL